MEYNFSLVEFNQKDGFNNGNGDDDDESYNDYNDESYDSSDDESYNDYGDHEFYKEDQNDECCDAYVDESSSKNFLEILPPRLWGTKLEQHLLLNRYRIRSFLDASTSRGQNDIIQEWVNALVATNKVFEDKYNEGDEEIHLSCMYYLLRKNPQILNS